MLETENEIQKLKLNLKNKKQTPDTNSQLTKPKMKIQSKSN